MLGLELRVFDEGSAHLFGRIDSGMIEERFDGDPWKERLYLFALSTILRCNEECVLFSAHGTSAPMTAF